MKLVSFPYHLLIAACVVLLLGKVSAWRYSVKTLATGLGSISQIVGSPKYIYVTLGSSSKKIYAYDRQLLATQSVQTLQQVHDITASSNNIGYIAYHGNDSNDAEVISVAGNNFPNNVGLYWFTCSSTCSTPTAFSYNIRVSGIRSLGIESSTPKLYITRQTAIYTGTPSANAIVSTTGTINFKAFNDVDYIGNTVSFNYFANR